MSQQCTCAPCPFCSDGDMWELNGELSKHHPCDDLADLIHCDQCSGEGVQDYCEYCMDQLEIAADHQCRELAN